MDQEKIVLDFGGDKIYILSIDEFDHDLNVSDLLQIDYSNILGEILTNSLIFNRIGNMKAEIDNLVAHSKVDLEILEAAVGEDYRLFAASDITTDDNDKAKVKKSKPTEAQINNYITLDEDVILKKKNHLNLQKQQGYVDSLYWAAKDKSDKLNKLSEKLRPEEFERELIEDTINGVLIKQKNKLFK